MKKIKINTAKISQVKTAVKTYSNVYTICLRDTKFVWVDYNDFDKIFIEYVCIKISSGFKKEHSKRSLMVMSVILGTLERFLIFRERIKVNLFNPDICKNSKRTYKFFLIS